VVDQGNAVPIARRPGGNAVAPLSTRSARRRGLGITRRGAEARPLGVSQWSTRGTWSLPCPRRSARRRGLGIARRGAEARPLGVAPWLTRGTWFRSLDGLEGTRSLPVCPESRRRGLGIARRGAGTRTLGVSPWSTRGTQALPCLSEVLDVEAWGTLDVELKLGRSMWHMVDQGNAVPIARRPGGNAVAPLSVRGARRRGLGIARRGAEARPLDLARGRPGERGRSQSARSLDVEAWGSLDGELELGRSTCPRGRPGERGRSPVCQESRRRGLGITRRGAETRPLGVAPWLIRGTWFRSLDGLEGTRSLPCLSGVSTSRPGDRSAWSWNSAARRGMCSTRGTWLLPCLSGVLDVEAWGSLDGELELGRSWNSAARRGIWSTRGTRSLPVCPESRRRGLGIARRGMWSTRGTWSLPCLSEVLDVEASGSLGVELELGRSAWPRGRPGERGSNCGRREVFGSFHYPRPVRRCGAARAS
jgi:hypothetical protein